MRCFEIMHNFNDFYLFDLLNNNMRCFEIDKCSTEKGKKEVKQ